MHQRNVAITSSGLTFDVDIYNELQINQGQWDTPVTARIVFTDSATNQEATAETTFTVVRSQYSIIFKGKGTPKPGLPYYFSATVKRFDGAPAPENSEIIISVSFDYYSYSNQTYFLDAASSVQASTNVPSGASIVLIRVSLFN